MRTHAFMTRAGFALGCALLLGSAGRPQAVPPAFDAPQERRDAELGLTKDTDPPSAIRSACRVYPGFAVVEVDDPALKGAAVRVRSRSKGMSADTVCAAAFKGPERTLEDGQGGAGYFWGVVGRHVFLVGPDDFGVMGEFSVFDAGSGGLTYRSGYNLMQGFSIEKSSGAVGASFHKILDAACVPAGDDPCWRRILKDNAIPESARLGPPRCAGTPGSVQLSARVLVADLARPRAAYLGGPTTCDPTP